MSIVTLDDLKAQLSFTDDMGELDDTLLAGKIDAAQDHIERLLGFKIEDEFGVDGTPSLKEAVLQLAAHWYENREAAGDGLREIPFGVDEIVREYRGFTF
ncbi:DNA-packaging protein [Thioclava dalianensis]|uniref:DNA-packaging protein n=1 Tax=Thioclava dalianensis TaxID=1185766 RepID=A0A074U1H9_9RHOB|nr:head-tail connector protein [Thioclava dalianensis]KEP68527.1 DNA-packaging protein [Thioclava dalianensis]SFN84053.1 uncharacterized phage protein (possible DNA packaging)/phage conserved hypothetical protein, phiE125 gp8 family [Thioclava dalianensis]